MEGFTLPAQVEDRLAAVLPSEDALDRPGFDARAFINRNFPDESALSDVSHFVSRLRERRSELDAALSQASQDQSLAAHQALTDLRDAKSAAQQLATKIVDIRGKAQQSEVMVHEICRDIKQLDLAKRHLQTTLTALKRLQMLVQAVDELELAASQRSYQKAAPLLEASHQLFSHFDAFTTVPKIVELHRTLQTVEEELSGQIFADFRAVGPLDKLEDEFPSEQERNAVYTNLSSACQVVDALGRATRDQLIRDFCEDQLQTYEREFGDQGEKRGLKGAEDRYPWFYKLVNGISDRLDAVFPPHWQIRRRLCIFFCESTRGHMISQMQQEAADDMDVTLLLRALQRTLQFERDCADRFEGPTSDETEEVELNDDGELLDSHSAEAIKRRHRRRQREAEREQVEKEMEKRGEIAEDASLPTIRGFVSKCFDPFMSAYVHLERKNMAKMLDEAMLSEVVDRNGALPVLASSVSMFAYVRNSIRRCTALANGQTFYDLHLEFRTCFKDYASRLIKKLPASTSDPSGITRVKLANEQEEELCFIINTAEYCAETLPSLEEAIQNQIDAAYKESVDLSEEVDVFYDTASSAMKSLVDGLNTKLDDDVSAIGKKNWANIQSVGDESSYVSQVGEKLRAFAPTLRTMLSPLYWTNFCDKLAAVFIPNVLRAVLKCRRVNGAATQQLLLDVYGLKTMMLQLPQLGSKDKTVVPARYSKYVGKEMGKVESVLKLLGTPNDMLVESFLIMWPDGGPTDLQSVLAMKGMKKGDQVAYLEQLNKKQRKQAKKDARKANK